jgi:hypothetical protein
MGTPIEVRGCGEKSSSAPLRWARSSETVLGVLLQQYAMTPVLFSSCAR